MSTKAMVSAVALAVASVSSGQVSEGDLSADHPEIRYWESDLADPVTRLANDVAAGRTTLEFDDEDGFGYLPSLFDALGVDPRSQTLVFSKTSLQQSAISPDTPRAIYFSDDVAIGFVPDGEAIELASVDPVVGVVLYRLANRKTLRPHLERPKICLACHQAPATLGVPGVYVGSVMTTPSGRPRYRGSIVTDHRTPFEERWGGWYVNASGRDGFPRHRGNAVGGGATGDESTPLAGRFDADRYPTGESDVVALMTLEHQTLMTNLLIRLGWEARVGVELSRQQARIDEVVRYMLFLDEKPLPNPIRGASTFAEAFVERGPKDSKGRSLRELELETRLFRYPLSYLIYGDTFDALPENVRGTIYERLYECLDDGHGRVANARAILEILRDTKPDLPSFWMATR